MWRRDCMSHARTLLLLSVPATKQVEMRCGHVLPLCSECAAHYNALGNGLLHCLTCDPP